MGEGTKRDQSPAAALKAAAEALSAAAAALAAAAEAIGRAVPAEEVAPRPVMVLEDPIISIDLGPSPEEVAARRAAVHVALDAFVQSQKPDRFEWSEAQLAALAELNAAGVAPRVIARQLTARFGVRISTSMVIGAIEVSAVVVPPAAVQLEATTNPEDWRQEALRLFDGGNGLRVRDIAKRLGRNYWTVYSLLKPAKDRQKSAAPHIDAHARPAPVSKPAPKPVPISTPTPARRPARPAPVVVAPTLIPASSPPPLAAEHEEGIAVDLDAPTDGPGIHLFALRAKHCRWPMGRGGDGMETYCGCERSRHGGPYCEEHAVKAHTPGCWPPQTPIKRPTRMARSISALPHARNQV